MNRAREPVLLVVVPLALVAQAVGALAHADAAALVVLPLAQIDLHCVPVDLLGALVAHREAVHCLLRADGRHRLGRRLRQRRRVAAQRAARAVPRRPEAVRAVVPLGAACRPRRGCGRCGRCGAAVGFGAEHVAADGVHVERAGALLFAQLLHELLAEAVAAGRLLVFERRGAFVARRAALLAAARGRVRRADEHEAAAVLEQQVARAQPPLVRVLAARLAAQRRLARLQVLVCARRRRALLLAIARRDAERRALPHAVPVPTAAQPLPAVRAYTRASVSFPLTAEEHANGEEVKDAARHTHTDARTCVRASTGDTTPQGHCWYTRRRHKRE